jgi:hypothetical protein
MASLSLAAAAFSEMCPTLRADAGAVAALAAALDEDRRALDATAARLSAHCSREAADAEVVRLAADVHAPLAPPARAHSAAYAAAQNARAVAWPAAPLSTRDEVGAGAGAGASAGAGAGARDDDAAMGEEPPHALTSSGVGAGATSALAAGLAASKRPRFAADD